jgi:hypothetical protein
LQLIIIIIITDRPKPPLSLLRVKDLTLRAVIDHFLLECNVVKFALKPAMKAHRKSRGNSYTICLRGCAVYARSRPLYNQKRHGTHCVAGWVRPRNGLNRFKISRPQRH